MGIGEGSIIGDTSNGVLSNAAGAEISSQLIAGASVESLETSVGVASTELNGGETAVLSLLGFGVVFAVLVLLMAVITVMSRLLGVKKTPAVKSEKAAEDIATAASKVSKASKDLKGTAPAAASPAAEKAVGADADFDMTVTLDGKAHKVSVEECVPRFTVTLEGKTYGVDVESIDEEAAE